MADGLFPGVRQLLFILARSGSLCATKLEGLAQLWGFGVGGFATVLTFWQEALVSQEKWTFSKITRVCLWFAVS